MTWFLSHLDPLDLSLYLWLAWALYWLIASRFVQPTQSSENWLGRLQHLVPLAIGFFLIFHHRSHSLLYPRLYHNLPLDFAGSALTLVGLLFAVWGRVHLGKYWSGIITLKEGHQLIRTGPYQFVRHPLYTGFLSAVLGSALAVATGDAFVGFAIMLTAYLVKIRREESLLTRAFPNEYPQFKQEVPALVPFLYFHTPPNRTIDSEAFHRAAMRSEQRRITALIIALAALAAVATIRALLRPQPGEHKRLPLILAFLFCGVAYELLMLFIVRRAHRTGRPVHPSIWLLNTLIECSVPTLALLLLSFDKWYLGPYRALVSPSILLYCFFIVVATLRLSPAICILSGAVSAVGYLGVFLFTRSHFPDSQARTAVPQEIFYVYPIMLFAAGVIAAAIAHEIRQHVIAALQEAETRRKLDRVEHDLQIARSIQMDLLPKQPPSIPGYTIAGFCKPADQTGGDYYDWIQFPNNKVIFTIADASGHGIGPALLVAACRAYFRAVASRNDPLERITTQVDALLAADIPPGRFITAAVALLEPERHCLGLYSAGHAPLFLYTAATDQVTTFDADQPPLGIGLTCPDEPASRARSIPLAPGDALVLVTDGFFECVNGDGSQCGIARRADVIRSHHALPADALIRRLHEEVLAFTENSAQSDDITALVIRRTVAP